MYIWYMIEIKWWRKRKNVLYRLSHRPSMGTRCTLIILYARAVPIKTRDPVWKKIQPTKQIITSVYKLKHSISIKLFVYERYENYFNFTGKNNLY